MKTYALGEDEEGLDDDDKSQIGNGSNIAELSKSKFE